MHLKSIPILPEQLGVPGGDQRLNLRGPADRGPARRAARGGGPAGEKVGICLAVAAWQIPTIFRRLSAEKRSRNARLQQSSKSRPSWEVYPDCFGRKMLGCCSVENPDHFQTVFSRKNGLEMLRPCSVANPDRPGRPIPIVLVAKCQAVAAWQISTVLRGPTEGSPPEGNPTEERGRRRRPLQVR